LINDDDDAQRARIRDIVSRIRDGFNTRNIDVIMSFYHADFLHDGIYIDSQRSIWLERFTMFDTLEIEVREIEIDEEFALARMILRFQDGETTHVILAPEMLGDMSYFYHKGEWRIHGNRSRDR